MVLGRGYQCRCHNIWGRYTEEKELSTRFGKCIFSYVKSSFQMVIIMPARTSSVLLSYLMFFWLCFTSRAIHSSISTLSFIALTLIWSLDTVIPPLPLFLDHPVQLLFSDSTPLTPDRYQTIAGTPVTTLIPILHCIKADIYPTTSSRALPFLQSIYPSFRSTSSIF